jgi:hypothetical protein
MVGEPASSVNLMDVDGYVFINSTVINSSWQRNGTLQIGGDLTVCAPKKTETSPMGNGLEMQEGTVVTFKGKVQHEVNFQTYGDSYITNVAVKDNGSLHLTGQTSGFTLVSDAFFADGSTLHGTTPLRLNGYTVYVNGSFAQDCDTTVDLTGSKMIVLSDYWHKMGILQLENSSLTIGGNYEMRAGYATAGSGELRMNGEPENGTSIMDVHGDAIFNSKVSNSSWQRNGTLAIGGDLSVLSVDGGKSFTMLEGTTVKFYGAKKHSINFTDNNAYTGAIMIGVGDSISFAGYLNGVNRSPSSTITVDPAALASVNNTAFSVTGASAGTGTIAFADEDKTVTKKFIVAAAEKINEIVMPEGIPDGSEPTVDPPEKKTRSAFEKISGLELDDKEGNLHEDDYHVLGWTRDGDWALYSNLDFEDGAYFFTLNGISVYTESSIELHLDGLEGKLIGTCNLDTAGRYGHYIDYTIPVEVTTGVHDLYLVFRREGGGECSQVNYFYFSRENKTTPPPEQTTRSAFDQIYFYENDGNELLNDPNYPNSAQWLLFRNLDFEDGAYFFNMNGGNNKGVMRFELYLDSLDGLCIGSFDAAPNEKGKLTDYTFPIEVTTGVHDLYLFAYPVDDEIYEGNSGYFTLNYIYFSRQETTPNPGSDPQASMRGDVNGDGSIDLKDVIVLRRYLAGGWDVTINEANSDVNSDGSIDLKDVIILRRYLAGGWDIVL